MLDKLRKYFYKFDKYNFNYKKFELLFIFIVIILCFGFTWRSFQNDTFYSITIGRDILKYGVDMIDHYSIHSLPYTYPHWLYDIIIYLLYSFGGFKLLYIFTIFLYILIGILLYFLTLNLYKNRFVSFVCSVLAIICISYFMTARAQVVSYILFILELFFIEKFLSSSNKKYLIAFPILSLLIVNMHCAVWIFFFLLFLPYICEYFISLFKISNKCILNKKFYIEKNNNIKYLVVIMFLCIFTGFITLNGDTPFIYTLKIIQGGTTNWIVEHKPSFIFHSPGLLTYLYIFLFLLFFKHKIRLSDFFLSIGLFILAFVSNRHVSLLNICFVFPLCRYFSSFFKNKYKNFSNLFIKFALRKWIFVIFIFLIISLSNYYFSKIYKQGFIDETLYPVEATNYIKDNLDIDDIRLFNEYNYGSYLLFRGVPVFIDSRSDLYTPEFNEIDRSIADDFLNVVLDYDEVFDYYSIDYVMLYKCDNEYCSGLVDLLRSDKNYLNIYEDDYFVIFNRVL